MPRMGRRQAAQARRAASRGSARGLRLPCRRTRAQRQKRLATDLVAVKPLAADARRQWKRRVPPGTIDGAARRSTWNTAIVARREADSATPRGSSPAVAGARDTVRRPRAAPSREPPVALPSQGLLAALRPPREPGIDRRRCCFPTGEQPSAPGPLEEAAQEGPRGAALIVPGAREAVPPTAPGRAILRFADRPPVGTGSVRRAARERRTRSCFQESTGRDSARRRARPAASIALATRPAWPGDSPAGVLGPAEGRTDWHADSRRAEQQRASAAPVRPRVAAERPGQAVPQPSAPAALLGASPEPARRCQPTD